MLRADANRVRRNLPPAPAAIPAPPSCTNSTPSAGESLPNLPSPTGGWPLLSRTLRKGGWPILSVVGCPILVAFCATGWDFDRAAWQHHDLRLGVLNRLNGRVAPSFAYFAKGWDTEARPAQIFRTLLPSRRCPARQCAQHRCPSLGWPRCGRPGPRAPAVGRYPRDPSPRRGRRGASG